MSMKLPIHAHFCRRAILTRKVGQTNLSWHAIRVHISRSVHARLQVSVCSGYDFLRFIDHRNPQPWCYLYKPGILLAEFVTNARLLDYTSVVPLHFSMRKAGASTGPAKIPGPWLPGRRGNATETPSPLSGDTPRRPGAAGFLTPFGSLNLLLPVKNLPPFSYPSMPLLDPWVASAFFLGTMCGQGGVRAHSVAVD